MEVWGSFLAAIGGRRVSGCTLDLDEKFGESV